MKITPLLVALALLALSSPAGAGPADQALPDRPAIAVTNYKGAWLPVVGADGYAPIVVSDGSPVTLGINSGMMLTVGDRYAEGFVTVADADLSDVPATDAATAASMPNELKATAVNFTADLTSDIDIPDAYALMIVYPPNRPADAPPVLAIFAQKIGSLQAGTKMHFSARLPKFGQIESPDWKILVFSSGRQVRSTGMGALLPDYFDRLEQIGLKKKIMDRQNKGMDAPIAVYRQMPLGLPAAIRAKYHGTTVKAEVRVSTDGKVVWAKPVGIPDPDLFEAVNKGFASWLFLPPMKDGSLVAGSAIIPFKL